MDIRKIVVLLGGYDVGSGITTYYPLDEGGGIQVEDVSQYGNNGILKNGPVWTLVDGVTGLTFDGDNDHIEDSKGRKILREGTSGFWSGVKIGDKTKIVGTGTKFYFYTDYYGGSWHNKKLEGQLIPDFADHCTSLDYFYCGYNQFSGALPSFAACTSLDYFYCHYNQFSGALPSFAACTSLDYFRCSSNQFSGALPSFAACTSLNYFYCNYNQFSGYEAGGFATQKNLIRLDVSANVITVAVDINAILADLRESYDIVGRVACIVKLEGGTNAAPTGQGVTDKNFLNNHGWTVTTN